MKMSDYFNLPLIIKRGDYLQDSKGLLISRDAEECGPYIAKAVNNHDKLVAMVNDLIQVVEHECADGEFLESYKQATELLRELDQ